jgi:hypothetical protein
VRRREGAHAGALSGQRTDTKTAQRTSSEAAGGGGGGTEPTRSDGAMSEAAGHADGEGELRTSSSTGTPGAFDAKLHERLQWGGRERAPARARAALALQMRCAAQHCGTHARLWRSMGGRAEDGCSAGTQGGTQGVLKRVLTGAGGGEGGCSRSHARLLGTAELVGESRLVPLSLVPQRRGVLRMVLQRSASGSARPESEWLSHARPQRHGAFRAREHE